MLLCCLIRACTAKCPNSQVFAKFDYRFQAGHSSNSPVTDCHENEFHQAQHNLRP